MQDHWWVQVLEDGAWKDLDVSAADAVPGRSLTTPDELLEVDGIDDLPSELQHAVTIRVVLECIKNDQLEEVMLVESPPLRPTDLLWRRVVINHVAPEMPATVSELGDAARADVILQQERWFPVISVGDAQFYTSDFTGTCEVGEATPPWLGGAVAGAIGAAVDAFGDVGLAAPLASTDHVSALRFEYQIDVPGEQSDVVRRQVFDLLDPTARFASVANGPGSQEVSAALTADGELRWRLALMGETEVLVVGHHLSREYIESVTASTTAKNARTLLETLRVAGTNADPATAIASLTALPHLLFWLASLRRETIVEGAYLARPNAFSYHRQQAVDANRAPVTLESIDIVANAVAVDSRVTDPFAARVKQGILDTNIEALVSGAACRSSDEVICPRVSNAGELYDVAEQQGVGWRVLASSAEVAAVDAPA